MIELFYPDDLKNDTSWGFYKKKDAVVYGELLFSVRRYGVFEIVALLLSLNLFIKYLLSSRKNKQTIGVKASYVLSI